MARPATIPLVKFVRGDPLTISVFIAGNLTDKTFRSFIKAKASDETPYVEWNVTTFYDSGGSRTWIVLSLPADTGIGDADSPTRLIADEAVYDIQQLTGTTIDFTPFRGTLEAEQDVTR